MSLARLAENEFLLLTAASAEWHDYDWLRTHLPADSPIGIENLSQAETGLVVTGPNSRQLLAGLCAADLSLPWLSYQETTIADTPVRLVRVSYVGELGWEVHCSLDASPAVFEALWAAGQPLGLKPFGAYAMDSMRVEKGYKSWKQDLSTDFTVLEAGLKRFVNFNKADFRGRQAIQRQVDSGLKQGAVTLVIDNTAECDAPYLSSVWQGQQRVGLVTSGNYGHRVEKIIALAVVDVACMAAGTVLEIEIFGQRHRAVVQPQAAVYDPDNSQLRA
jgi:dimethylglycine dehydrogenase